jgi:hypothetical protein
MTEAVCSMWGYAALEYSQAIREHDKVSGLEAFVGEYCDHRPLIWGQSWDTGARQ